MVGDARLLIFGYHWTQERLAMQKPITKLLPHLAQLIIIVHYKGIGGNQSLQEEISQSYYKLSLCYR